MVAAVRQLVSVYYAFGDTKTPVRVAAIDLLAFIGLAWTLRGPLGHVGVSIAVTGASLLQMSLLWLNLRKLLLDSDFSNILRSAAKTLGAALVAAVAARAVVTFTSAGVHGRASFALAIPGASSAATFVIVFFLLARMLRSNELHMLLQAGWRSRTATTSQRS
jgi:putative peptidoglycan lipid II flippase